MRAKTKAASRFSAVYDPDGQMVFSPKSIEDSVLSHFEKAFKGQQTPVFSSDTPEPEPPSQNELDILLQHIVPRADARAIEEYVCKPFSFTDLEKELKSLKDGKASGYDTIPNELLKNCSFTFKLYLQTFLNNILLKCEVPPDLNIGKVILLYKVNSGKTK